jgi:hypothetical protein
VLALHTHNLFSNQVTCSASLRSVQPRSARDASGCLPHQYWTAKLRLIDSQYRGLPRLLTFITAVRAPQCRLTEMAAAPYPGGNHIPKRHHLTTAIFRANLACNLYSVALILQSMGPHIASNRLDGQWLRADANPGSTSCAA